MKKEDLMKFIKYTLAIFSMLYSSYTAPYSHNIYNNSINEVVVEIPCIGVGCPTYVWNLLPGEWRSFSTPAANCINKFGNFTTSIMLPGAGGKPWTYGGGNSNNVSEGTPQPNPNYCGGNDFLVLQDGKVVMLGDAISHRSANDWTNWIHNRIINGPQIHFPINSLQTLYEKAKAANMPTERLQYLYIRRGVKP
jgi:hypothetical protein